MGVNKRLGAVFVSGLLLGAAAVAKRRKQPASASTPLTNPQKAAVPPPQRAAAQPTIRFPPALPEFEFGPDEPMPGASPAKPAALAAHKARYLRIIASLFVLTAAALIGAWMGLGPAFLSLEDRFSPAKGTSGQIALAGLQLNACPSQPAIAAAGEKDGQFPLQTEVSGLTATDIGSFLVIGKQSAAADRPRDAEVAFLMACRVADKIKGTGSVESADARYQLGAHYGALALASARPAGIDQAELLQRAEGLYADSLPAYIAKYGKSSDKSKQAAEGLSAVRLALAQPPQNAQPVPDGIPVQASAASSTELVIQADEVPSASSLPPASRPQLARAVPDMPQSSQGVGTSRGTGPSFDCRRARSNTEKMICSDAELARLDRELGRAYDRARNAAADPAAFRRQGELEWRRRETICQDRGCLLRWYAYRRAQLVSVIDGRGLEN